MDPISDQFPHLSTFNYASNDPISNVDLHGLQGVKHYLVKFMQWLGYEYTSAGTPKAPKNDREAAKFEDRRAAVRELGEGAQKVYDFQKTVFGLQPGFSSATAGMEGKFGEAIGSAGLDLLGGNLFGVLFRGTSWGYAGSKQLQRLGITPTSSDPLVATLFGLESNNFGSGVIHILLPDDIKGIAKAQSNVLGGVEKEVALEILPSELANKASITISVDEAREILGKMGFDLPSKVRDKGHLSQLLGETQRLDENQIKTFIEMATGNN